MLYLVKDEEKNTVLKHDTYYFIFSTLYNWCPFEVQYDLTMNKYAFPCTT